MPAPNRSAKVLRIEGLDEAMAFFGLAGSSINNKIRATNSQLGEKGESILQNHAHVITGFMRNNIETTEASESRLTIMARAGYSGYENNRGNPHDFFDRGINELIPQIENAYVQMINDVISSRGR